MQTLFRKGNIAIIAVAPDEKGEGGKFLAKYQEVRHHEFAERMRSEPRRSDGLEQDEDDQFAAALIVLLHMRVMGGCRVINGDQVKLPVARELMLDYPSLSCEVSRFTLKPLPPALSELLEELLCVATFDYCATRYEHLYAHIRTGFHLKLTGKYAWWRHCFVTFGTAEKYHKNERDLSLIPGKADIAALAQYYGEFTRCTAEKFAMAA